MWLLKTGHFLSEHYEHTNRYTPPLDVPTLIHTFCPSPIAHLIPKVYIETVSTLHNPQKHFAPRQQHTKQTTHSTNTTTNHQPTTHHTPHSTPSGTFSFWDDFFGLEDYAKIYITKTNLSADWERFAAL
jgi:hypothetical protein